MDELTVHPNEVTLEETLIIETEEYEIEATVLSLELLGGIDYEIRLTDAETQSPWRVVAGKDTGNARVHKMEAEGVREQELTVSDIRRPSM